MQRSRAARRPAVETPPRHATRTLARCAARLHISTLRAAASTLAVAALISYLALTPLVPFARDTFATEVRRHVIMGGIIALYVAWLTLSRRLPQRTPFDLPIFAVVLAVIASVLGAIDRRLSIEAVLTIAPAVPVFYVLTDRQLADADALRRGVMLAGVTVAAFALASVWRQWQDWLTLVRAMDGSVARATLFPPSVPRVEGAGSHPNVLGGALAMTAPFFVLSLARAGRTERMVAGTGLALVVAALFFTLARAAWVAAFVGVTVTCAGLAFAGGRRRLNPRVWMIGGAGVLALAAAAAFALGGARPDWLFRDSLDPRADMRRVGIEVFRDNPLTGAGPGLYVALYPEYGGRHAFAAVHSHNVPIQIAADYGVVGLAAGVLLLGTVIAVLRASYRRGSASRRQAVAAATGVLAAFLVDGLADSPHLFPEISVLLAAALGLALRAGDAPVGPAAGEDARSSDPPPREWRLSRRRRLAARAAAVVPALAVLVGVALIPTWWYADRAAAEHKRSVRAVLNDRLDDAVTAERRATELDPRFAGYFLQLGAVQAARYLRSGDAADRHAAIRAYARGLDLQPRNGAAQVDLATLRLDAGDADAAWQSINRLQHLAGRDSLLQLAYAVLVQRAGSEAQAVETYAGLLALNPTLALTPFWRDDEFRSSHYGQIVDRALVRAQEITGPGPSAEGLRTAIRVLTGRDVPKEGELRAALAAAPGDEQLQVALGRLLTAGGRLSEAEPLLRAAVRRRSDSADARAALGDWYAATGDTARGRREWLAAAYLGDVRAMDALGESFARGTVPEAVIRWQQRLVEGASIARYYLLFQSFRFTFLRHEPVPIITSGGWLDALPDALTAWQEHLQRWQADRGPVIGNP